MDRERALLRPHPQPPLPRGGRGVSRARTCLEGMKARSCLHQAAAALGHATIALSRLSGSGGRTGVRAYQRAACPCSRIRCGRGAPASALLCRTAVPLSALTPSPSPTLWARGVGAHGGAPCCAFPLSRLAGEGDKGGEGNKARLPVHACTGENSPRCRDSVPNRCTLVRFVSLSRGAGEGERAAPLAHFVGEEPGLRATKLLNPREIAPNSPRIAPSPLDIRAKMCYTIDVNGATPEEPP
jgi:hypothetical protein